MRYQKQLEKLGVTPGKLALIGVLIIVLVVVVVKQLPESTAQGAATTPTIATQQLAKAGEVRSKNIDSRDLHGENKLPAWPSTDLSETLANNPFTLPSWFVLEDRAVIDNDVESGELADLQEQGASIVMIADGHKSARIGDQKYRIGDVLEGYQVTDITIQGIVLNRRSPQ